MPRHIALTFDDGPGPSTSALLDVLERHGARATFFLLGRNLEGEALGGDRDRAHALAARAARDGHLLGNHTMTHAPELEAAQLLHEVSACDDLIRASYARADRPAPPNIPIRLPFGPFRPDGARCLATLEALGRPHCHWTGDPQDWRPGRTSTEIVGAALAHVELAWRASQVPLLLLHDCGQGSGNGGEVFGVVREATVAAVDELCRRLRDEAPMYLTVDECPDPVRRFRSRKSS